MAKSPLGVEQSPAGGSWGSGSLASRGLGCSGFSEEHRRRVEQGCNTKSFCHRMECKRQCSWFGVHGVPAQSSGSLSSGPGDIYHGIIPSAPGLVFENAMEAGSTFWPPCRVGKGWHISCPVALAFFHVSARNFH